MLMRSRLLLWRPIGGSQAELLGSFGTRCMGSSAAAKSGKTKSQQQPAQRELNDTQKKRLDQGYKLITDAWKAGPLLKKKELTKEEKMRDAAIAKTYNRHMFARDHRRVLQELRRVELSRAAVKCLPTEAMVKEANDPASAIPPPPYRYPPWYTPPKDDY